MSGAGRHGGNDGGHHGADDGAPPAAQSPTDFIERLRHEGASRYHDQHPFHTAMHDGRLTRDDLARWVLNRYYYQTRIPIKDALIVSKSEDPAFRRAWLRRIRDHDGDGGDSDGGGLQQWLRLAEAVGLDAATVRACRHVLPGVRFACDAYVSLVRDSSLVVAVASSLTEFFAPDLMARRIAAWEHHYPFVEAAGLAYFRARVPRARRDSEEAVAFVAANARTRDLQDACVGALIRKTEILWHLLDCVASAAGPPVPREKTALPP
ncbi:MAG: pyrroloquinoline-quinone synthase PqqC [Verrucomicrobiota bacterium]